VNRFARNEPGGLTLAVFDKQTGTVHSVPPSRFLTLIDDHSPDVEVALGRLEDPAARAVARLLERAERIQPGPCPLAGDRDNLEDEPTLREVTQEPVEGMRLFAVPRSLAEPPPGDRLAIARYLGLMFTRAPKMEQAISAIHDVVRAAYEDEVAAMAPALLQGTRAALDEHLADARFVGLRTPEEQSEAFAAMPWYVVRAPDDEPFLLGDSPVVATIQIGHDEDSWRPLLSEATYVVCMPLSARICLIAAPQALLPIGVESPFEIAGAINRLSWRWSDRYVVGPTPATLAGVRDAMPPEAVTSSLTVEIEAATMYERARLDARKALAVETARLRTDGRAGGN
jgi:hypothetical protein